MRILIISDTHGRMDNLWAVLSKIGNIDMLIHLGDICGDEDLLASRVKVPICMVPGNNDWFSRDPSELVVPIAGKKVFMVHGHQYGVSYGLDRLRYRALELGADIVMFGHTHVAMIDISAKPWILNPGSLSIPRTSICSYMLADIDEDGDWEVNIKYVD